jgi:spore maturation protein CgeB
MQDRFRIAYLAHTLRSDWNNGNAHFLRGLMRALGAIGHQVTAFETIQGWSIDNLRTEAEGERSLTDFRRVYPDVRLKLYRDGEADENWRERLRGFDVVVLHEWNAPELAQRLLRLRAELGFSLMFHDTHHRASSTPEQMERFGLGRFDGVLVFGRALERIYRGRYGLTRVWTLHEAADTTVFTPVPGIEKTTDIVWVGNWGEGERSREIAEFLLEPVQALNAQTSQKPNAEVLRFAQDEESLGKHGEFKARIYGVRYPQDGLRALRAAGVEYGGYLPNLDAPEVYAAARLTVHIPRQQYAGALEGIPTIRVFEALASGIPLISAPWRDVEGLFREGDFWMVASGAEMLEAMQMLLRAPCRAKEQAARGLEQVLLRHTCAHRAAELTEILKEVRQ